MSNLAVKSNIHRRQRNGRPRQSRAGAFRPIPGGTGFARFFLKVKDIRDGRNEGSAHTGSRSAEVVRSLSPATVRPVPGVPHRPCDDDSYD